MATYESKKYAFNGANITSIAATGIADGSVDNTEFQFINTLSSNAQTQISGSLPKAGGTMTGNIVFADNDKVQMGNGTDMKVYSNGTNGVISVLNGFYVTNNDASENIIYALPDGSVQLFHNNVGRFMTEAGGCRVDGGLAVGTTSVGSTTGEIRAINEITAYYSSDERLKENIRIVSGSLNLIKQLQTKRFDWKEDYEYTIGPHREGVKNEIGFIAQDVEKVIPELVTESSLERRDYDPDKIGTKHPDYFRKKPSDFTKKFKFLNYEKLIPFLVDAMQEQQEQIEELQKQVKELQEK